MVRGRPPRCAVGAPLLSSSVSVPVVPTVIRPVMPRLTPEPETVSVPWFTLIAEVTEGWLVVTFRVPRPVLLNVGPPAAPLP